MNIPTSSIRKTNSNETVKADSTPSHVEGSPVPASVDVATLTNRVLHIRNDMLTRNVALGQGMGLDRASTCSYRFLQEQLKDLATTLKQVSPDDYNDIMQGFEYLFERIDDGSARQVVQAQVSSAWAAADAEQERKQADRRSRIDDSFGNNPVL